MSKGDTTGNQTIDTAFSWLSSHPVSAARRDKFRTADTRIANARPSMSAGDWASIKTMCGGKKAQSKR